MTLDLDFAAWRQHLRLRDREGATQVFDIVRKKWVVLSSEEMVRQLLILYFHHTQICPANRMSVERQLTVHGMARRYDLVLFDTYGRPWLLAECKNPSARVSQSAFDQAAKYNFALKAPYLLVTNGWQTLCAELDFEKKSFVFVREMPRQS